MVSPIEDSAERYVKEWLVSVIDYDEDGNPIRALGRIYSTRLLEELSLYNRGGNFDLVSALFMWSFIEDDEIAILIAKLKHMIE